MDPCSTLLLPISTASATSRASPVWIASGRCCACASSDTRADQQQIQAVVQHSLAPSGLQDRFDAVDPFGLQFAHLFAGLLGRLRRAHQLRLYGVLDGGRQMLDELGAMATLGGEHGSADEELRAQLGAVGDRFPQLE